MEEVGSGVCGLEEQKLSPSFFCSLPPVTMLLHMLPARRTSSPFIAGPEAVESGAIDRGLSNCEPKLIFLFFFSKVVFSDILSRQ